MSSQREYRKWRAKVESEHGYQGVTFRLMVKSGKVVNAEAWSSINYLGSWPPPPLSHTITEG